MSTFIFLVLIPMAAGVITTANGIGWFDSGFGIVLNTAICLGCVLFKMAVD